MTNSTPHGRLSDDSLQNLPAELSAPAYDRSDLVPSIVHIGVGGFHRAHLATYVDELCRAGHRQWSIVGTGVMACLLYTSPSPRDATLSRMPSSA